MDKIKTFIVDDEINNIKILEHFIKAYCPSIEIVGTSTTSTEAISLIDKLKPELIFLDIILNKSTGFDVLEEITFNKSIIIFVTAFNKYAIKAFKYNAIDYLLKPINISELICAVNRVQENIINNNYLNKEQIKILAEDLYSNIKTPTKDNEITGLATNIVRDKYSDIIAIPSLKKIDLVSIATIEYIEADGKYTIFHIENEKKIIASRNLGEYLKILNPNLFFRIHHKYAVNLNKIVNIYKSDGNYCVLSNGINIPIAKRKLELFNKFLKLK